MSATGIAWREKAHKGGQIVSPVFDTPEEAGLWLREHPPLFEAPTLIRLADGRVIRPHGSDFYPALSIGGVLG